MAADDSGGVFQTVDHDDQGNVITGAPDLGVDADGDSLAVVDFAAGNQSGELAGHVGEAVEGAYGIITMQAADGSWAYALKRSVYVNFGEEAYDEFSYTVSDGHGGFDTAHLDILIHGAPFPGAL